MVPHLGTCLELHCSRAKIVGGEVTEFYRHANGSRGAEDDLQVLYTKIRNARDGGGEAGDEASSAVDYSVLTSPKLCELSDAEFRALVSLWVWVARFGEEGESQRDWLRTRVQH